MSEFTSQGTLPFPDCYHDNLHVRDFSALGPEGLDNKTNEYGAFLQRRDIMPRARAAGERILDHLLFEMAHRDGIYSLGNRAEDETGDCA